jgi:hypothetical protein
MGGSKESETELDLEVAMNDVKCVDGFQARADLQPHLLSQNHVPRITLTLAARAFPRFKRTHQGRR